MQYRHTSGFALLFALTFCTSCSRSPSEGGSSSTPATGPVTLCTVNYPLQYFAQRIGGQHVKATFPAPADTDPAYWRPSPEVIADFQKAELILLNGASYAKWTRTVSLPNSRLVDTSASFRNEYIKVKEAATHSHGPGGEHAHTGTAFTTWLDPRLAIAQAAAIQAKLVSLRPQHEDDFNQGFASLQEDLQEIDSKITALVANQSELPLLFSHPVYQYFARRYGLNAETVHWEPDEMPSETMWQELAELRERHPAAWMIWEDDPDEGIVAKLQEMDIKCVVFAPCGNFPEQGDYLSRMRVNVENLANAFESDAGPR